MDYLSYVRVFAELHHQFLSLFLHYLPRSISRPPGDQMCLFHLSPQVRRCANTNQKHETSSNRTHHRPLVPSSKIEETHLL
ncbi:hypothetical protein Scep_004999 [Stephania cephalantha]|uniref:Uncharacterized protein n=1 Tax=Stephania cephalantha TaxID=152367 RepID=A0AAP0PX41_9MAGN